MTAASIVALSLAMLALAAMPSSSVLLVTVCSLRSGFRHGAAAALGIVLADCLFVLMAVLGMAALAQQLGAVFAIIKVLAAGYLIFLGWQLWRGRHRPINNRVGSSASLPGCVAAGLLLTLADVKAIVFYASLLPLFVEMQALAAADVGLVLLITVLSVGGVKLLYAALAPRLQSQLSPSASAKGRAAVGVGVMAAGAGLLVKP
mgnify:CR=1 FL=1